MKPETIEKELKKLSDKDQAAILQRFFKTGPGEYGEGDRFLGIKVPVLRSFARSHQNVPLGESARLLRSPYHEARMVALFILIRLYEKGDDALKEKIFHLYLRSTKHINNWDLVDLSAPNIVGDYLLERDRKILFRLVKSKLLWERRIAVLATFTFIRNNDFADTLRLAEILIDDAEDLMHKAVGWMLRETGKRDNALLKSFLQTRYQLMPRTMLRYAIEKFPETERKKYLKGSV